MKGSDAVAVDATLAACINAFTLGPFDALSLPFLDETSLHLGDHAEHGQDDVAHLSAGRDVGV